MRRLTSWLAKAVSYFLAFLWFDLFRIRRQVVLDNLAIAFPDLSRKEHIRIGRQSLRNLALNLVEYGLFFKLSKKKFDQYFELHNGELLEELLKRNHGVLMLTCHLGHGDLACAALSLSGFPMVMVSKTFKWKWLNDFWFNLREKVGTRFVPPRDSSYALLKALKQRSVVVIPLDQFTGPPIGVRTTFFGKETGTAAGLAVMAQRSKAPVVSAYTKRLEDGRHAIFIVREVPVGDKQQETLEQTTQRFNGELEEFVRSCPDQWMWIHRRWKKFKY